MKQLGTVLFFNKLLHLYLDFFGQYQAVEIPLWRNLVEQFFIRAAPVRLCIGGSSRWKYIALYGFCHALGQNSVALGFLFLNQLFGDFTECKRIATGRSFK